MNSRGSSRAIAWFLLASMCGGWTPTRARAGDSAEQPAAAGAPAGRETEEPPEVSGSAQALVAVHRKRYAAMTVAELARQQSDVEARCLKLRRDSDPIENEYRQQLAALRDRGQFSATAFGVIAAKRQALLQKWIQAVAEVAALPRYENDPLVQAVLEAYLQEADVSERLEGDLAALAVDDHLPDEHALRKAQERLRAAEREREPQEKQVTDGDSGAGKREHVETREGGRADCERSKAKVAPAPACSERQRTTAPCKRRRPRCG